MTDFKYPLSVMRGYKPPVVRYVWYIVAVDKDGNKSDHCGMTFGGVTNLTNRSGKTIEEFHISDLQRGKVYHIKDVDEFMKQWSDNYLEPEWKIPGSLRE